MKHVLIMPDDESAPLTEEVGELVRVAGTTNFVVGDKFNPDQDEVPIAHVDPSFREHLWPVCESGVEGKLLRQQRLLSSSAGEVRAREASEGHSPVRVAFAHIFEYLKTAERNRWLNFLVVDAVGRVWRLIVFWHYRGWWIKTRTSSEAGKRWYAGERLIIYG